MRAGGLMIKGVGLKRGFSLERSGARIPFRLGKALFAG